MPAISPYGKFLTSGRKIKNVINKKLNVRIKKVQQLRSVLWKALIHACEGGTAALGASCSSRNQATQASAPSRASFQTMFFPIFL